MNTTEIICYGITRGHTFQQEWYETASHDAGTRAKLLRKRGYMVSVSSMGSQVTPVGRVKMTLLTIHNPDDDVPLVRESRM